MKTYAFVTSLLCALFVLAPAHANECLPTIEKIDQQFTSTNPLPLETMKEAQKLRNQGAALCEGGSVQEGLAILDDIKTLLGIQ